MEKLKKLAFYEIDRGRMAIRFQKSFEEIQKKVAERGEKAELCLKIIIHPSADNEFGSLSYDITQKTPKQTSIKLTTSLNKDGLIVSDGKEIINTLELELFPENPLNIIKMECEK